MTTCTTKDTHFAFPSTIMIRNVWMKTSSSCGAKYLHYKRALTTAEPIIFLSNILLRNSCPYTTYPTFSFPPMEDHTSPLTNSSPHRTDTRTHPHSSPMPRSFRTRSDPIIDTSSCFTSFRLDPLRSSTGPSVCWSPFISSYVFPF